MFIGLCLPAYIPFKEISTFQLAFVQLCVKFRLMQASSITLNIAGIIINIHSALPSLPLISRLTKNYRIRKFIYKGTKRPEINMTIHISPQLPSFARAKTIFQTFHFGAKTKDWNILTHKNTLIYSRTGNERPQIMVMNKSFTRIHAYLPPKDPGLIIDSNHRKLATERKGYTWGLADIIYDFLQILITGYLGSVKKDGLLIHATGIKNLHNEGLLFLGKSGAGKTTLARMYQDHSRTLILNDECIIIRKIKNRFFIFSSPWHGELSDYFSRGVGKAVLKRIFLLNKAQKNKIIPAQRNTSTASMQSTTFLPFWDKKGLGNTLCIIQEISANTPCFKLHFKKGPSILNFIEKTFSYEKIKASIK